MNCNNECVNDGICNHNEECMNETVWTTEQMRLIEQIRADERRKFAEWLSRKHGINTCIGLINGHLGYKELDADEVLQDYEDSLKGCEQNEEA